MKEKLDDYEEHFQVKFEGYRLKTARVGFDTQFAEEGIDSDLTLTLADFRELYAFSKVDGIQSLLTILNLQDSKPSEYLAAQILANKSFENFGQVLDTLKGNLAKKKRNNEEDMNISNDANDTELIQNSRAFRNYLEEALLLGSLSRNTTSEFDLLKELSENDLVIIKGKQKLGEDSKIYDKYLTYLKIFLVKVLMDRTRYYAGTSAEKLRSVLNHPLGLVIAIDEADTLVPESGGGFLSQLIVSLATKYRKWGINVVAISQNAGLLNHVLIQQSDALFISRLKSSDNLHAVLERGISREAAEILRHLETEEKNSLDMLVNEWTYISPQNEIITFFPAVPLSDFKSQ
jgi:DNA helicase HerA-like ATPase